MSRVNSTAFRITYALLLATGAFISHPAIAQTSLQKPDVFVALKPDKLTDYELSTLRGGFELSPGVKVYFSFSQISRIGDDIVQTVTVPQTEISGPNQSA